MSAPSPKPGEDLVAAFEKVFGVPFLPTPHRVPTDEEQDAADRLIDRAIDKREDQS